MSVAGADKHLMLVTGLSGGGKSTALRAIEDLGFYCVDNLPAALLPEFAAQIRHGAAIYSKVALGIDAEGALRVRRDDGEEVQVISGDVTLAKEDA